MNQSPRRHLGGREAQPISTASLMRNDCGTPRMFLSEPGATDCSSLKSQAFLLPAETCHANPLLHEGRQNQGRCWKPRGNAYQRSVHMTRYM